MLELNSCVTGLSVLLLATVILPSLLLILLNALLIPFEQLATELASTVFSHLLVMAVGEDPVLLLRVEEKAEDVEIQPVLLVGGSFIRADQKAALYLRIG